MSEYKNILASGIADKEHLVAFDKMVHNRFNNLEVQAALIYLIDTVDAALLPLLAEQFDVLGHKGWIVADSYGAVMGAGVPTPYDLDKARRTLIKNAVRLHRYKGTPWAIKESLKSVGFYDVTIVEGIDAEAVKYLDGTWLLDGEFTLGGGHWADFRVVVDLGAVMGITAGQAALITALINEYKNVRSRLTAVTYTTTLIEENFAMPTEEFEVEVLGAPA